MSVTIVGFSFFNGRLPLIKAIILIPQSKDLMQLQWTSESGNQQKAEEVIRQVRELNNQNTAYKENMKIKMLGLGCVCMCPEPVVEFN